MRSHMHIQRPDTHFGSRRWLVERSGQKQCPIALFRNCVASSVRSDVTGQEHFLETIEFFVFA